METISVVSGWKNVTTYAQRLKFWIHWCCRSQRFLLVVAQPGLWPPLQRELTGGHWGPHQMLKQNLKLMRKVCWNEKKPTQTETSMLFSLMQPYTLLLWAVSFTLLPGLFIDLYRLSIAGLGGVNQAGRDQARSWNLESSACGSQDCKHTVGGFLLPWSSTDRKASIVKANGGSLMLS